MGLFNRTLFPCLPPNFHLTHSPRPPPAPPSNLLHASHLLHPSPSCHTPHTYLQHLRPPCRGALTTWKACRRAAELAAFSQPGGMEA